MVGLCHFNENCTFSPIWTYSLHIWANLSDYASVKGRFGPTFSPVASPLSSTNHLKLQFTRVSKILSFTKNYPFTTKSSVDYWWLSVCTFLNKSKSSFDKKPPMQSSTSQCILTHFIRSKLLYPAKKQTKRTTINLHLKLSWTNREIASVHNQGLC